jgi:acyl-CoA dehydrogenase
VATVAAEPIEARLRAAAKEGRLDAKLPPGSGIEVLVARAEAAGIISGVEAATVISARDLTAKVIRVDDFAQDLGASEMRTAPVPGQAQPSTPIVHKAAA